MESIKGYVMAALAYEGEWEQPSSVAEFMYKIIKIKWLKSKGMDTGPNYLYLGIGAAKSLRKLKVKVTPVAG